MWIFKSLNCALCSTPYSKTAKEVNTPTQTLCYDIQAVCMKCREEQRAIACKARAHQCKDFDCFRCTGFPPPSYCLMELLSSGCFTLNQNLMGYVQTTPSITIPECPICNEEYSIENSQREPFILQCGHGICNGCFTKMSKPRTNSIFKYDIKCLQCKREAFYAQESWENPLKIFLRELSEKKTELKRTCGECKKEAPLFEMFQCNDCVKVMLCSLCVVKKHRQHQIVDLEVVEVKKLMNATYEVITPQIKAYDVCFPELQADLIGKIHNFQAKALEKAGKIEGLNYYPAEYEKEDCLAIGAEFKRICEKYLGDLRSCNTEIEVKKLTLETRQTIIPQITTYDVCFPELQANLMQNVSEFQLALLHEIDQLEALNFNEAIQLQKECLEIGENFEEICEKYLGDLRLCNSKIGKLIERIKKRKTGN